MFKKLFILGYMFIAMQANTMMVEPIWKNVNDPRAEAFSNVEVMRQHLML